MNTKRYWKLRKIFSNIIFKFKSFGYKCFNTIETSHDYIPFGLIVLKKALEGIIKGTLIAIILLLADGMIINIKGVPNLDCNLFLDVVICCLGITGVILGLYCANISSIYSAKYSTASEAISNAFQYDRLTRRCISGIINYIIFGFIIITEILLKLSLSWVTVLATTCWTIVVIISYGIAGNRAYQLSDIYRVTDDSLRLLKRIVNKDLITAIYLNDANFQNHFQKVASKQIRLLQEVQRYSKDAKNNNVALLQFMCRNLVIIEDYWKHKNYIAKDSYWFKNQGKYQKWHFASETEVNIALSTGTALRAKSKQNLWWFEDEILAVNNRCLEQLIVNKDYPSLYSYLECLSDLCQTAIENKEVVYYAHEIDHLEKIIESLIKSERRSKEDAQLYAGMIELLTVAYLNIILKANQYLQSYDIKLIISKTIDILNSGVSPYKSDFLRGHDDISFYEKISTEVKTTGKRLTPDWLIAQHLANEVSYYSTVLENTIIESISTVIELGKTLLNEEALFEGCIVLAKFFECESKLSQFLVTLKAFGLQLESYHLDKQVNWETLKVDELTSKLEKWKQEIPVLLSQCTSKFTLQNWDNGDEYPDFLGESFYHISEDCVKSITYNNIEQFQVDFENLSKLMLFYQEYIRTDLVKEKDKYRLDYTFRKFTAPIIEWAQIGGLGILWGEFNSEKKWVNTITQITNQVLDSCPQDKHVAESIISYANMLKKLNPLTAGKDMLEQSWNINVMDAIRASDKYEVEYTLFGQHLKTKSKLLKAFFHDCSDLGFDSNPAEIFLILCINPKVPESKRYHSRFSWEEGLNSV